MQLEQFLFWFKASAVKRLESQARYIQCNLAESKLMLICSIAVALNVLTFVFKCFTAGNQCILLFYIDFGMNCYFCNLQTPFSVCQEILVLEPAATQMITFELVDSSLYVPFTESIYV